MYIELNEEWVVTRQEQTRKNDRNESNVIQRHQLIKKMTFLLIRRKFVVSSLTFNISEVAMSMQYEAIWLDDYSLENCEDQLAIKWSSSDVLI